MASIRERPREGRESTWAVLYRQGGKQRSTTFVTHRDAERFCTLIETLGVDRALNILTEEAGEQGVTVAELFAQWIDWKQGDVTPRTVEDYKRDYENWIAPHFGHRAAAYITEGDIQKWVDKILRPQLSAKSVVDRHALLHGIYKWASANKRGLVPHNPTLETDLPKRYKKPPKGLTWPEWLALKDAAYRVDTDAADLILFMASTGWRIGEATALMPLGVDDMGDRRFYVEVTHVNRKGEGVVAGAKSEAGFRRLRIINSDCRDMIRRRLVGLGPRDYVFTNPHSPRGLWEPSTFRNRWWKKVVEGASLGDTWRCMDCEAAGHTDAKRTAAQHRGTTRHHTEVTTGRNPTPHWLRHTHVLMCHMAGMTLAEIQRRIGHEDIKTTINVYGRMIDDMSDDVADRLDALLSGRGLPVLGGVVDARELPHGG